MPARTPTPGLLRPLAMSLVAMLTIAAFVFGPSLVKGSTVYTAAPAPVQAVVDYVAPNAAAGNAAYIKSSTKSQTSMVVYFTGSYGAKTFHRGYAKWADPVRGAPYKVCLRVGTHAIMSGKKYKGNRCYSLGSFSATEWNVRFGA